MRTCNFETIDGWDIPNDWYNKLHLSHFYNKPLCLKYRNKYCVLSCGTSDDVYQCHDREYIYILSENSGLGYIGLQMIEKSSLETIEEMSLFFQYDYEIKRLKEDYPQWDNYSSITKVKKLLSID